MTHPTRFEHPPALKVAVERISDDEMTRMCLAVHRKFGSAMAWRLMDLIAAARKEVREMTAGTEQDRNVNLANRSCEGGIHDHPRL